MLQSQVFMLCPKEEVLFLPASLSLLKKNMKGDVTDYHILGTRDEKLSRMAYDLGAEFNLVSGEMTWAHTAETLKALAIKTSVALWFPRALLLKSWTLPVGPEATIWGNGWGLAGPVEKVAALIESLTGLMTHQVLDHLDASIKRVKPRVKVLTPGLFHSWDQHLGFGGNLFLDGVVFQEA